MAISVRLLLKGTAWTTGAFLLGNIFRLLTSIILARILAPEIFGVMLIVYTIRAGIELTSDFGVGQNIVYNKNAEDPEFYNTAWTLQLIRNVVLFVIFLVAVVPAARFYESPILIYIMPLTAFSFLFTGLTSVSPNLLRKRLQFAKLNVYDVFLTGFIWPRLSHSKLWASTQLRGTFPISQARCSFAWEAVCCFRLSQPIPRCHVKSFVNSWLRSA